MRKLNLISGVLGLAALGLTACSSHDIETVANQKAETDQTRFISVQICSPMDATTRAFQQGTTYESNVAHLDFLFFDQDGNPTGNPQPIDFKADDVVKGPFEDGNVSHIYTSVVPVELAQGAYLPSQVICIVNGDAEAVKNLQNMSLEQIREVEQREITRENNFIMTNSVYFGLNTLTGTPNDRLCATPINVNSQLFESEDKAKEAITNATNGDASGLVNIYVERMAAKVGLTMNRTKEDGTSVVSAYTVVDSETGDDIELTFNPEYWLMNATDKTSYLTKHYGTDNDGVLNFTPTFEEIYDELSGWTWNSPENHRSYWAASRSYFATAFPYVSDQVSADNNLPTDQRVYLSRYLSYNDVVAQAGLTLTGGNNRAKLAVKANETDAYFLTNTDTGTGYIYCRETTTPEGVLQNVETGNPAASVASAVIVGKYMIAGKDAYQTFYIDRNDGNNGKLYQTEKGIVNALAARQQILFTMDADGNYNLLSYDYDNFVNNDVYQGYLSVEHPDANVRAKLANAEIAGRLVTLQLNTAPTGTNAVYYYNAFKTDDDNNVVGGYEVVTQNNLDAVNAQLCLTGYVDVYYNGLAFFSIPIRHLNFKATGSYNDVTHQYDWENMKVGELGVVRNHVYNITVTGISGLGTGLHDENQPIVPAKDTLKQYIAMRLNILAWNIANTWSVEL